VRASYPPRAAGLQSRQNDFVRVVVATLGDFDSWLQLAGEVQPLFGPMVDQSEIHQPLKRNIERSTALCSRVADDSPGSPLLGGLLFSPHPPRYVIGWLAVTAAARGQGVGGELVRAAVARHVASYPCVLEVETFGADHPGARSRGFYQHLGFQGQEEAPAGPEGGSRQWYRLALSSPPLWLA
jgi:ribosomal protein S18 acetylase RimI-like enzyme